MVRQRSVGRQKRAVNRTPRDVPKETGAKNKIEKHKRPQGDLKAFVYKKRLLWEGEAPSLRGASERDITVKEDL